MATKYFPSKGQRKQNILIFLRLFNKPGKNYFNLFKLFFLFLILGFVVYYQSLFNGFVWDDLELIPNINTGHNVDNITKFFFGFNYSGNNAVPTNGYEVYYKPLFFSVIAIIGSLFGSNAFFYHLFQVMLHIINACLAFVIFKYFVSKNLALILSLLFLIHPINTEAVVFVSALQEPLFFFFGMTAFVVLNAERLSYKRLLLGGLLMLCSLLSKETGILFLITICLFYFMFKKSRAFQIFYSALSALGIYLFMRLFLAKVFLVKLMYVPVMQASIMERLQSMPAIFFYYVKTFFYPRVLMISQHWLIKSLDFGNFYLPLFVSMSFLLILLSFGIYSWKLKKDAVKPYVFFSFWFLLGMGVHLQIIPLDMTVAERWFYFPIVGLLGTIGVLLSNVKFKIYEQPAIVLFIAILSLLTFRTITRSFDWKTPLTLYSHDVVYNDASYDLESNLGAELFRLGKKEEAKEHFERSVALAPKHWINWANLAGYHYDRADYVKAEKYYEISIKNGPNFQPSYENYGRLLVYYDTSNGKRVKEFLDKSVKRFPKNGKLWLYLAIANYQQGLAGEALIAAKQAYVLEPNDNSKYVYLRLKQNLPPEINIK